MINDTMGSGMMGFGGIWMLLIAILVILAIAALVKYLMR
jgi:hypothetical protein